MNPARIPILLQQLEHAAPSPTVYNPYRSSPCRRNLTAYLEALCAYPYSGHLLVGEAPGYRGCALTGIPFSSERILATHAHPFIVTLRPSLTVAGQSAEASATIVWHYLGRCAKLPAFWNVFPFHPHRRGKPQSNRAPTAAERRNGNSFVQLVLEILAPHTVIAVGRTAARALDSQFPDRKYIPVRHPSHGGKVDFVAGLRAAGVV